MPMLDMPLEELFKYQGINPRPADFDEFWDKSLEEMRAIDPEVELIPAGFKTDVADCYDMYFNGTKDSRIYAKFLKPKNVEGKIPAVLMFHGYTGKSHSWPSLLSYVASGFAVAFLDCRGQAGNSEDGGKVIGNTLTGFVTKGLLGKPEDTYYRNVFLDTAMLARIVMDMDFVDENRVAVCGGSQGGALSLVCAALEPRIKLAVPCYPFLSDYKRTWEMDLDVEAYIDMKMFFRQKDPLHEKENEYFEKLGYTDIQHLAPRIKAEVLMLTGLLDNICPPSTQFAAYNKITSKKNVKIYPDFGHELLPDHEEITYEFIMQLKD